ncbi:hypothetical protein [Emticicia sp. BO119]|uniref:hypothetical protein n=1 Tax=Emticicia sp. BO119 TaxID=2757768 RepID=UPI0015F04EE9|nr:hypothetical protein [Emticicia sp. BO119]MBA4853087.1 hypothetical protein [Emticicia sp. BO119]
MPNINNFRVFLAKQQKDEPTFSLSGIEEKLELPSLLLQHFIKGRKDLGEYSDKVIEFFTSIGYDDSVAY